LIIEHRDAVVVGSGLAGLTAALELAPLDTLVITKADHLVSGSTPWAQGGLAVPRDASDVPLHIADTLSSGAGYCDPGAVAHLIEHAGEARDWLESQGVVFDRDANGDYQRGQEGAHSARRILHVGADASGRGLATALAQTVSNQKQITLRTQTMALQLTAGGILLWENQRGLVLVQTPRVLLTAGGYGQLYSATTAPEGSTGDAMALALRFGLELRDLEMVQFHPTALAARSSNSFRVSLLTEALRGEGARIVTTFDPGSKQTKELDCDPLSSRDILSRAVYRRIHDGFQVYLDARHLSHVAQHFPTALALCQEVGLHPQYDLLPIRPAVHYTMGGIPVDLNGRTEKAGLWAAGEASRSGVHGANRLASNSLLECVVWGRSAGKDARSNPGPAGVFQPSETANFDEWQQPVPGVGQAASLRSSLQAVVDRAAGPLRDGATLQAGLEEQSRLQRSWEKASSERLENLTFFEGRTILETRHLFALAQPLLHQALARKESLGAHFRIDAQ